MNKNISPNLLLLAAMVEGASVMVLELGVSRLIAPFYGNSIVLWASVISVTLIGLAAGYFWGSRLSEKDRLLQTTTRLFLAAGLWILVIIFLSHAFLTLTLNLSLYPGTILSAAGLMLFPLACFGAISPVLIRLLADMDQRIGFSAGRIFTVSTISGVIMTLLLAAYLLPGLGIKASFGAFCAIILLISGLFFHLSKK